MNSSKIAVTAPDQVEALLAFIQPLVKDVVEDGTSPPKKNKTLSPSLNPKPYTRNPDKTNT